MYVVGAVEIVAGIAVALKPRYGAYVVAGWLGGIIINLLTYSGYYDVALRDFGLLLGALTLARLASVYDPPFNEPAPLKSIRPARRSSASGRVRFIHGEPLAAGGVERRRRGRVGSRARLEVRSSASLAERPSAALQVGPPGARTPAPRPPGGRRASGEGRRG